MFFRTFACLFALTMLAASTLCQTTLTATKLDHPPTIDGTISENEWPITAKVTGFIDPYTGASVADQTDAWIAFDDQAIYVAMYAHESQPGSIVARDINHGSEFDGEDSLVFRINTFGTKSWDDMSKFVVNPLNTQSEGIAGGHSGKREWIGEWQSAVRRQADGWSVEMRIPWKILSYAPGAARDMDINFIRFQARTKIRSLWQNETPAGRPELMGRWLGVVPAAASTPKPWSFLAYAAPEFDNRKFNFHSGIDIRYKASPTLTGLVSINPDFRNIENEIAGIDFTHTERYLDDARPFFNEGSDFFGLGGDFSFGKMFYSQRIGAFDVGGKLYGKLDSKTSVGALTTLDNGRSSATVAKLSRQFSPFASASVFATKLAAPGMQDTSAGMSAYRRMGNFSAAADGAIDQKNTNSSAAGHANVSYEVPHWFSQLSTEYVARDFDPSLAYIPWSDRKGTSLYLNYNNEYRNSPIREFFMDCYAPNYTTVDGVTQEKGFSFDANVTTKSDLSLQVGHRNVEYQSGIEDLYSGGVTINSSNRYKKLGINFQGGKRDGHSASYASLDGSFRILKSLDLGASLAQSQEQGTDRLAIVGLSYEMSPTQSVTGRVVSRNGHSNAYVAYRNGGGVGTEYYLIIGDPNAESSRARISVKVVWAF